MTLRYAPRMIDRAHLQLHLTVDLAILTVRENLLHVLVIERANEPYQGQAALPGGFLRAGEDLRGAAERELAEEPSLDGGAVWSAWPTSRSPRTCPSRRPDRTPAAPAGHRSRRCVPHSRSTTPRSLTTPWNVPGHAWSSPRWPPRSAGGSSLSATCATSTRSSGAWRSTRGTSAGRSRTPKGSSSPPAPGAYPRRAALQRCTGAARRRPSIRRFCAAPPSPPRDLGDGGCGPHLAGPPCCRDSLCGSMPRRRRRCLPGWP